MKKATTIDKQIEVLESRGLEFDLDPSITKSYFEEIGYYSLGFFIFPFEINYPNKQGRNHKCKPGSKFSEVVLLYQSNVKLRNILLKYLAYLEDSFRAILVNDVSLQYEDQPCWFVDPEIMLFTPEKVRAFKSIYNAMKKKSAVLKAHHDSYEVEYAPAWKTLEFLSFGQLQELYENLRDEELKAKIALHFNMTDINLFIQCLSNAVALRNICAHSGSIFDYRAEQPLRQIPSIDVNGLKPKNLYYVIKYLSFMLKDKLDKTFNTQKIDDQLEKDVIDLVTQIDLISINVGAIFKKAIGYR